MILAPAPAGAAQGVGKGIATALCKAGATVFITGRRAAAIERAARDVTEAAAGAGAAVGVVSDAASDEATEALFERVLAEHGRLDVLVNNVTMNLSHVGKRRTHGSADQAEGPVPWWERDSLEEWDVTHRVGLRSYFLASSLAARAMASQREGLIANISSFGGVRQYIGIPHGVVKTATDRMAADMADDLARHGVACVSLYPGLVRTEKMLATPAGPRIAKSHASETPEFTGRAIVALALMHRGGLSAQEIMGKGWSGRTVFSAEVGVAYPFVDAVREPPSPEPPSRSRSMSASLSSCFLSIPRCIPPEASLLTPLEPLKLPRGASLPPTCAYDLSVLCSLPLLPRTAMCRKTA